MPAPAIILELVERFREQRDSYKGGNYNETQLRRQLPDLRTPHEKTAVERQIAATDAQIDRLVYELYGLTADEIKIVEGATA